MTKQTNESESLGVMIARMQQKQIAKDWNKKSHAEKVADLKKHQEDLKKRMAEGKNHTWKSEGHYTKDGKEWAGPQHAHDGQVMTGEKHTADSQPLYHFKELSPEVKKKVLEKMKMDEGIVNTIMKSKTLNKGNYAIAAKELDKKMKKDPSKSRSAHAHDVARYVKNIDARKLAAEDMTPHQKRALKKEIRDSKKEPTQAQKNMNPETKGRSFIGSQTGQKAPKRLKHYDAKKVAARKGIERHLERKREKEYWDDDFDMTGCPLLEKLNPGMGIGKYIKDFKKSDAPQFKGASASKRRKMAIAAYLGAKRKKMSEAIEYNPQKHEWGKPEGTDQMKSLTPGQKNPKEDPIKPLETSTLVALNVRDEYVKETKEMAKKDPVAKNLNKFNKPATHRDRKNDYSRKEKHKNKIQEETEAGETKAEYRDNNAIDAPELGIVPFTQDEIAHMYAEIDTMTEDEMEEYGFFDDDEDDLDDWDDLEYPEENDEIQITEILSVQGRLKRKFEARKNRQKLRVARNIALRRGSSPDRLKKRAVRGARNMVYKRLLKGRDKSTMPPAEKARFERLIGMYKPLVQRFAVRMLPKMRKMEINRMKNRSGKKPQKAKKYKASKPIAKASSQKAKKFKVKK